MLLLPQIIICLVQPILSRRTEDIDVECIFEGFGFVWNMRWYQQHFSREHIDDLRFIRAYPETQATLEDVSNLLVLVRMTRHNRALREIDMGQHHAIAGDKLPREGL